MCHHLFSIAGTFSILTFLKCTMFFLGAAWQPTSQIMCLMQVLARVHEDFSSLCGQARLSNPKKLIIYQIFQRYSGSLMSKLCCTSALGVTYQYTGSCGLVVSHLEIRGPHVSVSLDKTLNPNLHPLLHLKHLNEYECVWGVLANTRDVNSEVTVWFVAQVLSHSFVQVWFIV